MQQKSAKLNPDFVPLFVSALSLTAVSGQAPDQSDPLFAATLYYTPFEPDLRFGFAMIESTLPLMLRLIVFIGFRVSLITWFMSSVKCHSSAAQRVFALAVKHRFGHC